jgi:hypothetical protein
LIYALKKFLDTNYNAKFISIILEIILIS